MKTWQLQVAKARLSELVKKAANEGPQQITVHGIPAVVVISNDEYEQLKRPRETFVQFMRQSPLYGLQLKVQRSASVTRKVDLE